MTARLGAVALLALAGVFVAALGLFAYGFWVSGTGVGRALAVGLGILTPIIAWTIMREAIFGVQTQIVGRAADAEDGWDAFDPRDFGAAREAASRDGATWLDWFRLSLSYDAHRDRRGARAAMREAIARYRQDPR